MTKLRIKQLRKEYKLTQKEFADLFNLDDSTISLYENGKREPTYDIIVKIADYFNVSIDWLLERVDSKNLVFVESDYIPKELLNIGVGYLKLAKEMSDKKIPLDDMRKIITAINNMENDIENNMEND